MPSKARDVLVAEVRESFGRVAYTHKTHEKEADRQKLTDDRVRLAQLVLSAITTAGLLGILVSEQWWLELISAIVSAGMAFLTAYAKNFRAGEIAKEHQATAHRLWLVREQYLSLLSDLEGEVGSLAEARARRDALQERLAESYESAPRTTAGAYLEAQNALQHNEELTFSDSEIDQFLPARLRKAESPPALEVEPGTGTPSADHEANTATEGPSEEAASSDVVDSESDGTDGGEPTPKEDQTPTV